MYTCTTALVLAGQSSACTCKNYCSMGTNNTSLKGTANTCPVSNSWPGQRRKDGETDLVDVDTGLGRSLHVGHAPLLGTFGGLLIADLALLLQVNHVAHQQEWNVFIILHSQYLLPAITVIVQLQAVGILSTQNQYVYLKAKSSPQ